MAKQPIKKPLSNEGQLQQKFRTTAPEPTPDIGPGVPYTRPRLNSPMGRPVPPPGDKEYSPLDDFRKNMHAAGSSKSGGGASLVSPADLDFERYDSVLPHGYNNEDAYGQGQGWGSKMASGIGKGLVLTGTTFLQSTVGMINGLGKWAIDGKFSSFYDNDFNRAMDDINKTMENVLPNYYTEAERNAPIYSPTKLFSANFIWDGVVKNLGFAAGAMLSGGGFVSAGRAVGLKALPMAARMTSMGKGGELLKATREIVKRGGNSAEMYAKLADVSEDLLRNYKIINKAGRITTAGLATTGEAGFEAFHALNEYRDKAIQEYQDTYGHKPTGAELDEINKVAEQIGNSTFRLNVGLLTATNYIQFPKIMGSSFKGESGLINSMQRDIGGIVKDKATGKFTVASAKSGVDKTLNLLRKGQYVFAPMEALEEGGQFAAAHGAEHYYTLKDRDSASILDSAYEGIKHTLSTNEGWENLVIGGLSGGIMLSGGKILRGEIGKKKRDTAKAAAELNKTSFAEFIKEHAQSVVRGANIQEDRTELLKEGNQFGSKNKEADYMINYLTPRIKYGRMDLIDQDIKEIISLASTAQGFAQLQEEGKALATETPEAFIARASRFRETAKNMETLYQTLNLRYGGLTTPEGKPLYSPDVMNKMIYSATKADDFSYRIEETMDNVTGTTVDLVEMLGEVVEGKDELYNKAVAEITANKDVVGEDQVTSLSSLQDIAKMALHRDMHIQEYEEYRTEPQKHVTPDPTEDLTDDALLTDPETGLKHKKGEIVIETATKKRAYKIGQEYYLGKIVEEDENGNQVFRTAKLVILGKNDDGTIKVKDGKGVRDVPAEKFLDYNLGTLDSLKKNKKAAFYYNNWNTVFTYNFGKKYGGKIRGRLSYDEASDKLMFVYKDAKGKIKQREVVNHQFVAKEGFSEAKIVPVGKLTSVQSEAYKEYMAAKDKRVAELRTRRVEILGELVTETQERIENNKETIEKSKENIERAKKNIQDLTDSLEKHRDKRSKASYNKSGKVMLLVIKRLEKEIQQTEQLIEDTKRENIELGRTIEQAQDMIDNIDQYAADTFDFIGDLKKDVSNLKELHTKLDKHISGLERAIDSMKKALTKAKEALIGALDKLRSEFLGMPAIEINNDNPQYLELEEALQDAEIMAFQDDDIAVSEARLKGMNNALDDAIYKMDEVELDIAAAENILEKFDDLLEKHKKEQREKEFQRMNKAIIQDMANSFETKEPLKHDNASNYQEDPKKTAEQVVTSTVPVSIHDPKNPNKVIKDYVHRAHRFGNRVHNLMKEKVFKGVIVTLANQEHIAPGLVEDMLEGVNYPKDKHMVFLITDSEGNPIDEFGNVIESKDDIISKGVYQVFPSEELENTRGSMFRQGTPNVAEYKKQYADWRNKVLADTTAPEPQDFSPSFGSLELIEILDDEGNVDREASAAARTSVASTQLVTNTELKTTPMVVVATKNESVSHGSVTFNTPLGRVFLKVPSGMIRLYTRFNTPREAEVIYKILHQLTKNAESKEGIKSADSQFLLAKLKTMIHWGIPKTPEGKPKPHTPHNVWFQEMTNPEGEKEFALFIGNEGENYSFTPTGLEENKEAIVARLQSVYTNVNATAVNERQFNKPYYEIIDINEDGSPETREWPNYQSYLLSDKMPNSKGILNKNRPQEDIPLKTRIRPKTEDGDMTRSRVYFTLSDSPISVKQPANENTETPAQPKKTPTATKKETTPGNTSGYVFDGETLNTVEIPNVGPIKFKMNMDNVLEIFNKNFPKAFLKGNSNELMGLLQKLVESGDFAIEVTESTINDAVAKGYGTNANEAYGNLMLVALKKMSNHIISKNVANTVETQPEPAPQQPAEVTPSPKGTYVLDGNYENMVSIGKLGMVGFKAKREVIETALRENPNLLEDMNALADFLTKVTQEGSLVISYVDEFIIDNVIKAAGLSGEGALNDAYAIIKKTLIKKIENDLQGPATTEPGPSAETKPQEAAEVKTPEVKPARVKRTTRRPSISESFDKDPDIDTNNADYRLKVKEETEPYSVENWVKISKWLKKVLPQVPVYRTQRVIQTTNGGQAWGMFRDAAIYVYQAAEEGTVYHEVFEAVWKMFTPLKEQKKLIKEFKDRKGFYKDRFTGEIIKYSEATPAQIKEELAEEFRDFNLSGKVPTRKSKSKIRQMFNELIQWIKTFFTGVDATSNTERLFRNINEGTFAANIPQETQLELATKDIIDIEEVLPQEGDEYRIKTRIQGISAKMENELYQHMTYGALSYLSEDNEGLFEITKKLQGRELYDKLRKSVVGDKVTGTHGVATKMISQYEKELEEIDAKIDELYQMDEDYSALEQREDQIIQKIEDLHTFIEAVENNWSTIVERHKKTLIPYEITFDPVDETLELDENNDGKGDYMDSNKLDAYKKASAAVKLLMATLPDRDADTSQVKPTSIGSVSLEKSDRVFITLMNHLHSSLDVPDMLNRLKTLAKEEPKYKVLYSRITGLDINDSKDFDPKIITANNSRLITGLWKVMKKQNPDVLTIFRLSSGDVVVGDTNLTNAPKTLRFEYQSSIVGAIKNGDTHYMAFDGKFYNPTDRMKALTLKRGDTKAYVNFLKSFNIDFSIADINKLTGKKGKYKDMFFDAVDGIVKSFKTAEDLYALNKASLDIDGNLLVLGAVKSAIDNPLFESTFYSIKGEKNQTYIGTNTTSNLYHALQDITNISQLANSDYAFLLTDKFAKGSRILEMLFHEDGSRKENTEELLKTVYIEGVIDEENGTRTTSSQMTFAQRLAKDIALNLQGVYNNLVPGDAALEWGIRMHTKDVPFITREQITLKKHYAVFEDYFKSEIELARDERIVHPRRKNTDLRFFKSILRDPNAKNPDKLHNDIVKRSKKQDLTAEEIWEEFNVDIKKRIDAFIKQESDNTKKALSFYQLTQTNADGNINNKVGLKQNMSNSAFNLEIDYLSMNFIAANIEQHKIIYSDPYIYSDELKRIKNFNSPRQALLPSSVEMNQALHNAYNEGFEEGDLGYTDFERDHFRTTSVRDVPLLHPLKDYNNPESDGVEETDGGGYVTLKAHRVFKIRTGQWNVAEEDQYRFEIEYEQRVRKMAELSGKDLEYAKRSLKEFMKTNPGVKSLFTMSKPIVSGSKDNGRNYNDTMMDKYALVPISFRMFHQMNPNSNMLKLYDKMVESDIDYLVFDSGRKVGAEKSYELYKDGKFNIEPIITEEQAKVEEANPNAPQTVIKIPFSIIALQTEVPSKEKTEVTRGSQVTKLVTLDFLESGVPIDYNLSRKNKESAEAYEARRVVTWNKMSDTSKEKNSPLYAKIKHNQRLLEEKTERGFEILLDKLGIKIVEGSASGYLVTDREKLISALETEIQKQDINNNILQAFDGFRDGDVVLEATPVYQQVRNILFSVARNNVIQPKINGGMLVQAPSTAFEEGDRVKAVEHKGKTYYYSDILDFYEVESKDETGKPIKIKAAELMVARWFDSPKTDEELLNEWYEIEDGKRTHRLTPEGKRMLSGVAFRTPTQKQNSIEAFVIKKLLPKEMGDTVVVPGPIVRKSGSDFDIDKLSVYLKNVFYDSQTGKPKAVEFLDSLNSTVEQRYIAWMKEKADADTKQYVRYLSRQAVKELRKNFLTIKKGIADHYASEKDAIKGHFKTQFEETFEELKAQQASERTAQDEEMAYLFDIGSLAYHQLSEFAQEEFQILKTEIARNGLKGPVEIESYLGLAQTMMQRDDISKQDKFYLNQMIDIYQDELTVLGRTSEEIDAIKGQIADIKINKSSAMETIGVITSQNYAEAKERFESQKESIELQWAQEVAAMSGLPTLQEFNKKSIYQQNTKKALENEYIDSLGELILDPSNFDRLIAPNSAKPMENISKEIVKILKKAGQAEEVDYTDPGFMLSFTKMSALRRDFIGGKQGIGIAAVGQTNHAQNQRTNMYVDTDRVALSETDRFWFQGGRKEGNTESAFKKYNKVNIGGRMLPSLSKAKNIAGDYISDIIGMFIDGYVDISKGPWIMEMGATPKTAGVWLYLVKIGIPIDEVAYFMNQPIIRDYLKALEIEGISGLLHRRIAQEHLEYWAPSDTTVKTSVPAKTTLKSRIGLESFDMDNGQLAEQIVVLEEFFRAAKTAEHLFLVTQGTNMDTANINDSFLVFKKVEQLKLARETVISSADKLLENSFIGILNERIQEIREAFSEVLLSDRNNTLNPTTPRQVLQSVLLPYIRMNDREFMRLSQKAVADFFDWALQSSSGINTKVGKLLLGDDTYLSAARQILKFKESVLEDKEHPLHDNMIINSIMLSPGERKGNGDIIILQNKGTKVHDQNQMINSFEEIKDYLSSPKGQDSEYSQMYRQLVRLAIVQSGLTSSPVSYATLLPYEDFKDVYNEVLSDIEYLDQMENFVKLGVFQRNNWNRKEWVPTIKANVISGIGAKGTYRFISNETNVPDSLNIAMTKRDIPKTVTVPVGTLGAREYITYQWVPEMSVEERQERVKRGDTSFINKHLMRRVQDEEGNPVTIENKYGRHYLYTAINAWGEGVRAQELLNYEHTYHEGEFVSNVPVSQLENGYIKVQNSYNNSGTIISSKEVTNQEILEAMGYEKPESSPLINDIINGGIDVQSPQQQQQTPSQDENKNVPSPNTGQTIKLRDGNTYNVEDLNVEMMEAMGYKPRYINRILKQRKC